VFIAYGCDSPPPSHNDTARMLAYSYIAAPLQIQCELPSSAVVGYKDVTLEIAGQRAAIPASDSHSLLVVCDADQYGHIGEACLACPVGAVCAGYLENDGADLRAAALAANATFAEGGVLWVGNSQVSQCHFRRGWCAAGGELAGESLPPSERVGNSQVLWVGTRRWCVLTPVRRAGS
jgi:hypothetical protein